MVIAYPDTSFLLSLYFHRENSVQASTVVLAHSDRLRITSAGRFEFRQAARFEAFRNSKDRNIGFTKLQAEAAMANFEIDIASRTFLLVPCDWQQAFHLADQLSLGHTAATGHRAFDILHVATALHLGAREFLTFDLNQRRLAEAEGLRVPF